MATKKLIRLIGLQATELQRIEVPETRAGELADEVAAINDTVLDAALELEFDDEPVSHARLLNALKPAGEDVS